MNRLLILSVLVAVASAASLSKKKTVTVTLLTESLCPGCIDFITNQLYPVWEQHQTKVNVDFVPYGNAQQSYQSGHWVFTCQHGDAECVGNKMESCAIDIACDGKQTKDCNKKGLKKAMDYIDCMENGSPEDDNKKCAKEAGLPAAKIAACASGDRGEHLENMYGNMTGPYGHTYTPWIVINGKHTEELQDKAQTDLMTLLCSKYIECYRND